jgi:hypothetical protein
MQQSFELSSVYSRDMAPGITVLDTRYRPSCDAVSLCQNFFCFRGSKNRSHTHLGQYCGGGILPFWVSRALFQDHIMHVVKLISSKQVIWVHAYSLITDMTDIFARRQRALKDFKRHAIADHSFTVERSNISDPIFLFRSKKPTTIIVNSNLTQNVTLCRTRLMSRSCSLKAFATIDALRQRINSLTLMFCSEITRHLRIISNSLKEVS